MNNKMHKNIDQLIADGKEEEACILIEEVWKKQERANLEEIAKLVLRGEKQEWRFRTKN